MTHLTPNLVAVPVPIGATDFDFINTHTKVLTHSLGQVELGLPTLDKFRFLGICTSSGPEFDAEGYVERHPNGLWLNYEQTDPLASDGFVDTSDSSFLSLMQSAGCWFENPVGPKPTVYDDPHTQYGGSQMDDLAKWEKAQSQSSPKWAILEKI